MLLRLAILSLAVLCVTHQAEAWWWRRRTSSACTAVNCSWGSWGGWSACRNGVQVRSRRKNRAESCGGRCSGSYSNTRSCSTQPSVTNILDQQCASRGGTCQYTSVSCRGAYFSGMCGGSSSRRCCLPNALTSDGLCHAIGGVCTTSSCADTRHSGRCGGASNRQCCTPARQNAGSACFGRMCSTHSNNQARQCDAVYGCGYYNARRGSRLHKGVDVKCSANAYVYAPFDGKIVRDSNPYGSGKACCNKGVLIRGTGTFNGWEMKIFYVRRTLKPGTSFRKGQVIGRHLSLHCSDCYDRRMTDHIHVQLYRGTRSPVDPTPYVYCP